MVSRGADVAVLTICNPPVNARPHEVRAPRKDLDWSGTGGAGFRRGDIDCLWNGEDDNERD